MDMCKHFAASLKYYRVRLGYSQGDLAIKLKITQQAVSLWENGTKTPRLRELERIASALKVSVGLLLGLEEIKSIPQG